MKKIKITVPKQNDKWKIQIGKGVFYRRDCVAGFNLVERKLKAQQKGNLASPFDHKTSVFVNYDQLDTTSVNEGVYETEKEALYVLATFLEDYLPEDLLHDKEKKYLT